VATASPLAQAEDAYWDAANKVLMNTESWTCLSSAMEQFDTRSKFEFIVMLVTYLCRALDKRDIAARILQRFFREKIDRVFKWKRMFQRVDHIAQAKIRQADTNATFITLTSKHNSTTISIPAYGASACTRAGSKKDLTAAGPSPALIRPDSAPNLISRRQSGHFKVEHPSLSRRGSLEEGFRPNTAPAQDGVITGASAVEAGSKKPPLIRSNSSMAASMAARRMVFSEHAWEGTGKFLDSGPEEAGNSGGCVDVREVPESSADGTMKEVAVESDGAARKDKKEEKARRRQKRFEEIMSR
jgi:hypothetical protein